MTPPARAARALYRLTGLTAPADHDRAVKGFGALLSSLAQGPRARPAGGRVRPLVEGGPIRRAP